MASFRCVPSLRAAVPLLALLAFLVFTPNWLSLRPAAAAQEYVRLSPGATIALATPDFLVQGKRYAFTWPGGGPPQTHTLKRVRGNGWVEVEVSDENVDPTLLVPGQLPIRWLNAALATSIQEMRPLP